MKHILATAFLTFALSACGGGDDRESPHLARCEAACGTRPATGGCAGEDIEACVESCVGQSYGLSGLCMQCRVDNAFWAGCSCTCEGEGCCLSCEDGDDGPSDSCAPTDSCQLSQETCNGMMLGSVSDVCSEACAIPGPDASF